MNRINLIFDKLREDGGKALMPFLTAGDPDLATTASLLQSAQQAGASVCEIGIPFSDPIADGPVIQASMTHALSEGTRVDRVLEMIATVRPKLKMGLVAMVSYSIVQRLGLAAFLRRSREVGVDGVIFPDLPLEESLREDVSAKVQAAGLICSLLIAPTTPLERAKRIAKASSGFVYLLSRSGITGEQPHLPQDLTDRIERLRSVTNLPIAVGFGVSNPQQVRQVVQVADAAIVGSAIMRRVAQHRDAGSDAVVDHVGRFLAQLCTGLHSGGIGAES